MRIGNLATTRFFVCNACRIRTDGETDVRAMANSGFPSLPCECGGIEWDELLGDERRIVIEHLGPDAIGTAVVYYCSRCQADGVQVVRAGAKPTRCSCGSRHFRKLVGPERIKLLRERQAVSDSDRQDDGSAG